MSGIIVHLSGTGGRRARSGLRFGDVPGGEKGPQRKEIGVQPGKPEFGGFRWPFWFLCRFDFQVQAMVVPENGVSAEREIYDRGV